VVPFSIALIKQASWVADFKQLFFQIFPNVFLLLRSCDYKATSVYASLLFLAWSISMCCLPFYFFSFLFVNYLFAFLLSAISFTVWAK